jgi:predicted ArsR family transcriptional regulator
VATPTPTSRAVGPAAGPAVTRVAIKPRPERRTGGGDLLSTRSDMPGMPSSLPGMPYPAPVLTDVATSNSDSGVERRVADGPTSEEFSAAVSAATSMFGDPTRRRIYLAAREAELGITAAVAAELFALHPNVARHHLDKLAAGGYLEVVAEANEGRSGRPSKRYRTTGKRIDLEFTARRHDLVIMLLSRALEMLSPEDAARMAEDVGEHYGRELAVQMNPGDSHRSMKAALQAVADALTAHGFAAHAEGREGAMSIVRDHCPFGQLSATNPVICAVDRGLVRGMLHQLYGKSEPFLSSSRAQGHDSCVSTHES